MAVKAQPINVQQGNQDYLKSLQQLMPGLLGLERNYRDDFGRLNLRDTNQFLQGSGSQPGLYDMSRQAGTQAADQIADLRNQEFKRLTNQTDQARGLFQAMSPEAAKMVKLANQDALAAQRSATGLTGSEQRTAQQFAREASADRGRVMDNSAMASEVLNRDDVLARKRAEASQLTNNAYSMSQNFYSQPGLQALYSTPQGYQAGQNTLGMGLGAIGSNRAQMVDPSMGFNLAAANAQNQLGASIANKQANATQTAGIIGGLGSLFGGLF